MAKLTGLCKNLKPGKCLQLAKTRNLKDLGIFAGVCLVLSPLIIYSLIQIISAYMLYRANKQSFENSIQKQQSDVSLLDKSNDNVDPKTQEGHQLIDEYADITKTIQNSFAGYKEYNAKMQSYYKDRQLEGIPDIIDQSILSPDNDDW